MYSALAWSFAPPMKKSSSPSPFAVEVDEGVFLVYEIEADLRAHVPEERRLRGRGAVGRFGARVRLANREPLIRGNGRDDARPSIGPVDDHRLEGIDPPDAEREGVVHTGLESTRRLELLREELPVAHQGDLRPDGQAVVSCAFEPH